MIKKLGILLALCAFAMGGMTGHASQVGATARQTSQLDQQWLDTVVSIEQMVGKALEPRGTGFLISSARNQLVLVTAKHVVVDADGKAREGLVYRSNRINGVSAVVEENHLRQSGDGPWFMSATHDLAVRFMSHDNKTAHKAIPLGLFLSEREVQAGTPLAVLGFPMGLRSTDHAMPIARRGMVGRVAPDVVIADSFVFPGNSGGPVLYLPPFRGGVALGPNTMAPSEMVVGMVSSYIPYREVAISEQTLRPRIVFEENSGLAAVVPAWVIKTFVTTGDVDAFDLRRATK